MKIQKHSRVASVLDDPHFSKKKETHPWNFLHSSFFSFIEYTFKILLGSDSCVIWIIRFFHATRFACLIKNKAARIRAKL